VKPLLVAGHGALEFLDTQFLVQGEPTELIGDGRAFVEWLGEAGLLEAPRASTWQRRFGAELDEVAAEARKTRAWANAWLTRWCAEPNEPYEAELQRLNSLLARGSTLQQILRGEDGRLSVVQRPRGEKPGELLAIVAEQIAALVTHEDPALVKRCAGASCTLWFLDRTKAHRRRFCSSTACGNRDKVAAFRQRQRESG
jgi:hypothetical protein